jgi:hypothetical protein
VVLVAVTVAPGITPPLLSSTVPVIEPALCANAAVLDSNETRRHTSSAQDRMFLMGLSFTCDWLCPNCHE